MSFQINLNQFLQKCNPKDIISFGHATWISIGQIKFIIEQSFRSKSIDCITEYILEFFNFLRKDNREIIQSLFYQGQECEILRAGSQGWQKGKIKINVTLEFIPDQPEIETSPLDDIRQSEIKNIK